MADPLLNVVKQLYRVSSDRIPWMKSAIKKIRFRVIGIFCALEYGPRTAMLSGRGPAEDRILKGCVRKPERNRGLDVRLRVKPTLLLMRAAWWSYNEEMSQFIIYGANGYTGSLIAHEAVARGMRPILAGRNAEAVELLAGKLRLEHREFALEDPAAVASGIQGVLAVLHCAGPFAHTSKAMADACLQTRAHYLDITGEVMVVEALAARDAQAKAAGVMVLPGAGYDVVPSDCLAAHLKRRLPAATHLALGMQSMSHLSRGTATTMVENLHMGGMVRQGGVLKRVPAAWKTKRIDFGRGPVKAITIPWGDVSTAFYSTAIPNIEMYMAAPWKVRLAARASRFLGWFLGSSLMQGYLKKRIHAGPAGPTDEQRGRGASYLWGEATDTAANRVVSRLDCPEGYTMTVRAAVAILERVLGGQVQAGFQTPSMVYGPDFVLGLEGVVRKDEGLGSLGFIVAYEFTGHFWPSKPCQRRPAGE
jgi:short subunit dehydrogenase-like uncharacterized protein